MDKVTDQILNEVNRVVLGKQEVTRKVLLAILAQGHVLLEDVPGVGKTTMANAFAKTLGMETKRVQFTSDTMWASPFMIRPAASCNTSAEPS